MQREEEIVLKGRLKEVDHLGNVDDVGREKIRIPDSDIERGPITGGEGFHIERLDPTGAHSLCVLHGSPQIFRAAGIPNLANLPLTLAGQGKMTHWKVLDDHNGRLIGPAARPS